MENKLDIINLCEKTSNDIKQSFITGNKNEVIKDAIALSNGLTELSTVQDLIDYLSTLNTKKKFGIKGECMTRIIRRCDIIEDSDGIYIK